MAAVRKIEAAAHCGELIIVTSREAWREQDPTPDPDLRSQLEQKRGNVEAVRDDHRMLGARANYDNYGNWYGTSPILTEIVDEELFTALKTEGFKDADARHLCTQCKTDVIAL